MIGTAMKQTSRTSSSPGFWYCSNGKKTSLDGGFSSKPCLSTRATLAEREKSVYVVKVQWDKETLQKRGWPCVWRMCDVFLWHSMGIDCYLGSVLYFRHDGDWWQRFDVCLMVSTCAEVIVLVWTKAPCFALWLPVFPTSCVVLFRDWT